MTEFGQDRLIVSLSVLSLLRNSCQNDRRQTVEDIRLMLGISHGTTHPILKEHLKYRVICAQWVLHTLKEEHRLKLISTTLSHLERYNVELFRFLSRIVAGIET